MLLINMPIYTKGGDSGETGLRGGQRIEKSSCNSEVIGNLDELNVELGMILCYQHELGFNLRYTSSEDFFIYGDEMNFIENIQVRLFELGTLLADPSNIIRTDNVFDNENIHTRVLEARINSMDTKLQKLKNFIVLQGNKQMMTIHRARALCRRFERSLISHINQSGNEFLRLNCCPYVNRLSDYLFTLARFIGHCLTIQEKLIISTGDCKTNVVNSRKFII